MYKSLFHLNSKGAIDFTRSVAQSVTWNAKGTVYTVHMNPKWHWSDGQPVTAQDVLFTWHLIQYASSGKAPTPWPYANAGFGDIPNGVSSIQALGTHAFRVTLTSPSNQLWFEYNGLSQLMPLPEQAWNKYPTDMAKELQYLTTNGNNPSFFKVVDGAFTMKSAVENQAWTFVPNPHYDGHKATLSQLILGYQTSDPSEVNQLRSNTIQIGYLPANDLPLQKQLRSDHLFTGYGDGFTRIFLDFGNPSVGPILKQLPVRQALEMGIDQSTIIKDIYEGYAAYGTGPVPFSQPSLLDPRLHKPPYPFDPAAGKALLEKAGWHLSGGVMVNAKGQKLSFVMQFVSGVAATESIVQLLKADWAEEGIQVSLVPMPFASMVGLHDKADASKWQIQAGVSWAYGGSFPTGAGMYGPGAPYNFYQFSSPVLDKVIAATHAPYPTPAASQTALDNYQIYVSKILPELWMPYAATLEEVSTSVRGVSPKSLNLFTGSISPQYWSVAP
jgi:peptide/nickel transport system substrate-binding protein